MKATIKDRIVAHRSAPDVYDPPTFEQMADRIEELEAKLERVTDVALRLYYGSGVVTGDMHATLAEMAWRLYGGKDE